MAQGRVCIHARTCIHNHHNSGLLLLIVQQIGSGPLDRAHSNLRDWRTVCYLVEEAGTPWLRCRWEKRSGAERVKSALLSPSIHRYVFRSVCEWWQVLCWRCRCLLGFLYTSWHYNGIYYLLEESARCLSPHLIDPLDLLVTWVTTDHVYPLPHNNKLNKVQHSAECRN